MTHSVQSGHTGGSLGCAEFFVAMYYEIMKHDPKNFTMDGIGQDVFFLSNGHVSPVWYSVLARTGYFDLSELATFRKLGSRLQGHPATQEGLPGIRVASGSLGQGLSVAIGAALTKKLNGDPNFIYSLHGDGEVQEGQIWEAAMFAAKYGVDNLISTIDYNGRQIDGDVDNVMPLGDLKAKWEAFGWDVLDSPPPVPHVREEPTIKNPQSHNGNDIEEVIRMLRTAQEHTGKGKPVMILMRTEMGNGVDFMMGTHEWHGIPPNDEQLENALSQLEETLGDW